MTINAEQIQWDTINPEVVEWDDIDKNKVQWDDLKHISREIPEPILPDTTKAKVKDFAREALDPIVGVIEAPVTVATAIPSFMAGTVAGAGELLTEFVATGKVTKKGLSAAKQVQEEIMEGFTVQPTSQFGQTITSVAAAPFEAAHQLIDKMMGDSDEESKEAAKYVFDVGLLLSPGLKGNKKITALKEKLGKAKTKKEATPIIEEIKTERQRALKAEPETAAHLKELETRLDPQSPTASKKLKSQLAAEERIKGTESETLAKRQAELEQAFRPFREIAQDINQAMGERGSVGKKNLTPEQQAAMTRLKGDLDVIKKNAQRTGKSIEKYLIDLGYDPKVAGLLARNEGEISKFAGSVNLSKQNIPEELKQVQLDIAPTKTVQTWGETTKIGKELASDYKKASRVLVKAKKGEALTAGEIEAARQINVNAISRLKEMAESGVTDDALLASFRNYQDNVLSAVSQASSEAGRALNIHKKEVSIQRLGKAISKLERGLNKRELSEFRKLNLENPIEVKNFMERLGDPKLKDYMVEYWYNAILSGPPTHLVNIASNTMWQAYQVPHKAVTAGVDKVWSGLTGQARTRYLNEIVPMLAGYKEGFGRGRKAAGEVVKTGQVQAFETKWAQEMGYSLGAFERSPNPMLQKVAPFITAPTRALRAMDVWAGTMAYDARMRAIARRRSNEQGLTGEKRTAFENKFLKNPPKEASSEALTQARYNTFMDAPDPVTQSIIELRDKIPFGGGRFIVPFVNTISNLTKRGLEMTPGVGLAKEAISRGMGRGHHPTQVIAKQIEGAVITAVLLSKVEQDEITGPVPQNRAERDAFYRQGKLPWAIKVGDEWHQYRRIEPFNTVIASVAIANDRIKNAEDDETATEIFVETMNGVKENLIDSSYFQGIQQVFNRHDKAKGAGQRFAASWVPYSSFWRSINRAYEVATEGSTKVRDTDNQWLKAFSQNIPGLSRAVPARVNVWGEEIEIEGGVFRQWLPYKKATATEDPVEIKLEELGVYPGQPYRGRKIKIRGEENEIPDEMYRDFLLHFGANLKKQMTKEINSPGFDARTPEQQIKRLEKRINVQRKKSSHLLRKKMRGIEE